MPSSAFRHHDSLPARISSPLYRQLIQEWISLNATNTSSATIRRWGRLEADLAGYDRPYAIVDAVDSASPVTQDRMLLSLIRLTQSGHQLAGRIALQLMLPKLGKMALRIAGTDSDNAWSEDRRHIVVAEFWDVLATYPVDRRPSKVAANLALDTLYRATAGSRTQASDIPVDPTGTVLRILDEQAREDVESHVIRDACLSSETDLPGLLNWAVANGTITQADSELMITVYLRTPSRAGRFPDAVRQRCSRARRQLTAAVSLELAGQLAS